MNEEEINVSFKKCCICNNSNIGEFTIINGEKYHLCCIENLQKENTRLNNLIDMSSKFTGSFFEIGFKSEQENTQLKQQLKDKDEKISKAIEHCNKDIQVGRSEDSLWLMGYYDNSKDILKILESNKED